MLNFTYIYNTNGQLVSKTFPDGMTENYTYDTNGNLLQIAIGSARVWERVSYSGQSKTAYLGTTPLILSKSYTSKGMLTKTSMSKNGATLHSFEYTYNTATGNMASRVGMNGVEKFTYDQFDRLCQFSNNSISYHLSGNIMKSSILGEYTYDNSRKHAVTQVADPNKLLQGTQAITYNAFNKVETVSQGMYSLSIVYGPTRHRCKTVLVDGSTTTTTLYADNYEQRIVNGTVTSYHYVDSPDGLIAVYIKQGNTITPYYIETDHLGSIVNAYDAQGIAHFSATYDAWGKQTINKNTIGLTRGYTGHEHWNQFGLIDMNGRFYDPQVARFLSPDPYIQSPDIVQNYNRYSYCLNNPLKYTDPSGEFWHLVIGAGIGGFVNWVTHGAEFSWKGLGYFGVGAVAGALGVGVSAGISSSLAGGSFGAGFVGSSTAMTVSSNFVTGAAIGGGYGISCGFTPWFGNSLLEGQSLGYSLLKGVKDGLIGGAIGALFGGIMGGLDAVADGRRFFDGAITQKKVLTDHQLPYVKQNGDYNCGPACGESVSKNNITQEQLRNALGGDANIDPIGDAYIWQEWSKETGRPFSWTRGGIDTQDILVNMQKGNNVAISLKGDVAHSVVANRITEQTIIKSSGKVVIKLLLDVMDPMRGQYYRISNNSALNAFNTFILFP